LGAANGGTEDAPCEQAGRAKRGAWSEIVGSIGRVSTLVTEISTANAEQAGGFGEVNEAVTHMDQATQQNAALVEQAAAAADSLRQQSASLLQSIQYFKTA
jgi:methyl-accepting chemotaxis protein